MTQKSKYISSAMLLLVTSVIVKIIGAVYKIPLTSFIGAVGRGYFASAYNLCLPLHAITMGSLPVAMSRLVSKYNATDNSHMIYSLKKSSSRLFSLVGFAGMMIMLLVAIPYSKYIASSKCLYTCLVLAPSILFSCMAASYRAYFEGFMNMVPTSISQTIEALFKMIFGLLFSRITMSYLLNKYQLTGYLFGERITNDNQALSVIYPFTSAAAMLGVTFGCFVSLVYTFVYYQINKPTIKHKNPAIREAREELLSFAFPIMISCAVQGLFQFLDTASIQKALDFLPIELLKQSYIECFKVSNVSNDDIRTYVFGLLNTALDFKNLIPGVTMALGVCAVPAISSAFEGENTEQLKSLITSIYKYTMLVSTMGGVFVIMCSEDILKLFYGKNAMDIVIGCDDLVRAYSVIVPIYCMAGTSVFIVQALGNPEKTIKPFIISGIIRLALNLILISNPKFILFGDVISDGVGYLVMCAWNIIIATKISKIKFNFKEIIIKPFFATLVNVFLLNILFNCLNLEISVVFNLLIKMSLCGATFCILWFLLKVLKFSEFFLLKKS